MWRARAFGLRLELPWRLTDLRPARGTADVRVSAGRVRDAAIAPRKPVLRLRWPEIGVCDVVRGRTITFRAKPGIAARALAEAGLQCALGAVLHQRHRLVLHASGVLVGSHALLLAGPPGAGKSTLAAALATLGNKVLCDDVALIAFRRGRPIVPWGLPAIRLQPDSAQQLHLKGRPCPLPGATKVAVSDFAPRRVPSPPRLGAVICLSRDGAGGLRWLPGHEAWAVLAASYYARSLLTGVDRERLLRDVAHAVAAVPVGVFGCSSLRGIESTARSLISQLG